MRPNDRRTQWSQTLFDLILVTSDSVVEVNPGQQMWNYFIFQQSSEKSHHGPCDVFTVHWDKILSHCSC